MLSSSETPRKLNAGLQRGHCRQAYAHQSCMLTPRAHPDAEADLLPCLAHRLLHSMSWVQGQLKSANVGDSGYMLLTMAPGGARYELRYHTPQQEHSFGCPYQLGHYEGADAPEDAMLMTLPVLAALMIAKALQLPQYALFPSGPLEHTLVAADPGLCGPEEAL